MEFTYQKNDNNELFKSVVCEDSINATSPQNYNPLYDTFFTMSQKNSNSINLNNRHRILRINDKITKNIFLCDIENSQDNTEVFFKYSPLIDPSKYIIGKYEKDDASILCLPTFGCKHAHAKIRDPNNAAYVDGFFTYLTSQILHSHNFVHALDFYGSFLALKNDFECNIEDDIEFLNDSEYFHKNNGTKFKISSDHANNIFNFDTRQNKGLISIDSPMEDCDAVVINDINDVEELGKMFETSLEVTKTSDAQIDLLFSYDLSNNKLADNSSSDCSSRSSITKSDYIMSDSSSESESESEISTASEDVMIATIPKFPVNVIALEKCINTLDSLIIENGKTMNDYEWGSIIIQVIMALFAYQKIFHLTHNDLHTNNIMYILTDKPFLYYKAGNDYYKVPTFGKIYKIIDFGRAIYKFRGNIICSDSYHKKGDAATQYNCEPYLNNEKPIIGPNFSFDLCRLGCSLCDFFEDDDYDIAEKTRQLIEEWCEDDSGRHVLYKKNGDERYPNFKLYKMISRTVHNHVPENELNKKYFARFRVRKTTIGANAVVMNIDELPCYALSH